MRINSLTLMRIMRISVFMNDSDKAIKAVTENGWIFKSQKGSHQKWVSPDGKRRTTKPNPKKNYHKRTKDAIEEQTGLKIF